MLNILLREYLSAALVTTPVLMIMFAFLWHRCGDPWAAMRKLTSLLTLFMKLVVVFCVCLLWFIQWETLQWLATQLTQH